MSSGEGKTLQRDLFGPWVAMFMLGCATLTSAGSFSQWWLALGVVFLLLSRRWPRIFLSLLLIVGFFAGVSWSAFHMDAKSTYVQQATMGPVDLWGRVDDIEIRGSRVRYVLSDLQYDPAPQGQYPKKVRVTAPQEEMGRENSTINVGDDIWLRARLNPLPQPVYPDGFDFGRNLYFNSIGAIGYSYAPAQLDVQRTDLRVSDRLKRVRNTVSQRIDKVLSTSSAAIAKALLIGERSSVDETTYDQIRRSGLAHVMAISGLHMGMVTGMLFIAVRFALLQFGRTALSVNVKKVAATVAIAGGAIYLLISGASTSTTRAFVMAAVVFTAIIFDRAPFSFRSIAIAAFVVLIYDPVSIVSAGFQMSFAAVTGLVFVYQYYDPVRTWISNRFSGLYGRILNWAVGLTTTTIVASLCVAPIAAYHFQTMNFGGVLANMLVIPIMALWVMPLGLVSLILMPFGLEEYSLIMMGQGIDIFLHIARFFADQKFGNILTGYVPWTTLALYGSALFFLSLRQQWLRWGIAPLCLVAALVAAVLEKSPDIIISVHKDVVVYRNDAGVFETTSHRVARFEQAIWAKMLGVNDFEAPKDEAICDEGRCELLAYDEKEQPWRIIWQKRALAPYGVITLKLNDVPLFNSSQKYDDNKPWVTPEAMPRIPIGNAGLISTTRLNIDE